MAKKTNPIREKMLDAGMPPKAWRLFKKYYVSGIELPLDIEIVRDPNVPECFAVRVEQETTITYEHKCETKEIKYVEDYVLMWTQDDWEDVEFTSWPPVIGCLKFFT